MCNINTHFSDWAVAEVTTSCALSEAADKFVKLTAKMLILIIFNTLACNNMRLLVDVSSSG
jgi:hypothetical protein